MKDGLISREALLNDLCEDREEGTFCFTDSQAEAADKIIVYVTKRINAQPSVPAVPLDKLCVWLAKFGCPCEINEGMCDDAHGVDRCLGIFNSSAFCWQYWLTKMMEEQDAAD